ncbi:MAG: tetratricopeptide repeat protein, partial [Vicinamibacterales bacterium]
RDGPRGPVFQYRGRGIDVTTVGLARNVRSLVTGRVALRGDQVSVQAELIDVAGESQEWGEQYRFPVAGMQTAQEEIAWHIAEALRLRLAGTRRRRPAPRPPAAPTVDTEAYQEYLRGRYQWGRWRRESLEKAVEHFEKAIARAPEYAKAWAGLADALGVLGYYGMMPAAEAMPRAKAAAARALEIDPSLAEAHATTGIALMLFEWRWAEAEAALRKAVALDGALPMAHAYLALVLVARGRTAEALASARRALELDPLSLLMNQVLSWVLYFSGEFESCLAQLGATLELDPHFAEANSLLIVSNEGLGRLDRAAEAAARPLPVFGMEIAGAGRLAAALEAGGREAYWLERLRIAEEADTGCGGSGTGRIEPLVVLGRIDEALDFVEQMVANREPMVVFLRAEPMIAPLRGHPRFEAALAQAGL